MTRLEGAAKTRARSVIDKGIGQRLRPLAERLMDRAAAVPPRQRAVIAGILGLVTLTAGLFGKVGEADAARAEKMAAHGSR